MELSSLGAKNKRVASWTKFAELEVQDFDVRAQMLDGLRAYRTLLARLWQAGQINQEDEKELLNLERKLESLSEEGRLRVVPKHVLKKGA